LSKVIDYCKYHKDNPPEEIQKPLKSFLRSISINKVYPHAYRKSLERNDNAIGL